MPFVAGVVTAEPPVPLTPNLAIEVFKFSVTMSAEALGGKAK
jgi:hypothetical protein